MQIPYRIIITYLFIASFIGCQTIKHDINVVGQTDKQVELSNIALKKLYDLGQPNISQIKQMLVVHDFKALDEKYEDMFEQYKKDAQYESFLRKAYTIFNPDDVSIEDLDLWVAQTGSYVAYAARGGYKTSDGYWARGGKSIGETPDYKIDKMQRLHDEAARDLKVAISKNPALMPAYEDLIEIAKASNMPFTPKQILDEAVKYDDRTFFVRYQYMISLRPRWGGSHEKMSMFAQQTIEYVRSNPRLWTLQGEVSSDLADNFEREGDYASAAESYSAALKFGDRVSWLNNRAECYNKLGQKDKAAADAKKVLYYLPTDMIARALSSIDNPLSLKYDLRENSYVAPKIGELNIKSYAVLSVEHHVSWLNTRSDKGRTVVNNNIAKIERMLKELGYECLERSKIVAILDDQKLSLAGLTNEKAQQIGQSIKADAVIIATIPSMGKNHSLNTYFEEIDIKAISVTGGQIIWNSLLKGSVEAGQSAYGNMIIMDSIESRLYDLLQAKLKADLRQVKDVN